MGTVVDGSYPVTIREARYKTADTEHAVYADGPWVIIAGIHRPDKHTEAFGSDTECRSFWTKVDTEGPFIEIEEPQFASQDTREIYVAAGDDPNKLIGQMKRDVETVQALGSSQA